MIDTAMSATLEKYRRYVLTSFLKKVQPIVIDRAEGATVWDENGKKYVDMYAGISVVNAGHCQREVIEAAAAQMHKLVHSNSYIYPNKPTADLAEALASIMPSEELHVSFFGSSGAEAVEGAMRAAKQFTGRGGFVALEMSFHGRSAGTLSFTGDADAIARQCAQAVARAIDFGTAHDVAAFIAEPVMGEGGIIVPPRAYFAEVKKILDDRGILFICDEVQSGFGRTGKMLAIEHYGVVPDIVVTAKGIADGFPLSAFTTREEIARSFTPGDHLSTFGGNPVCCAAALANLEIFKRDGLVEATARKGQRAMEKLRELAGKHERIGDVRGLGLMLGVEFVSDRARKTPDARLAEHVQDKMLERGFLVGVGGFYGNVVRIQPPLVIDDADLDRGFAALGEILDAA